MNSSSNKKTKSESDRNLKRSVVKLSTEEVNTFLVVFAALMQQTPCPKIARKAYLGEMRKRLRANGVGFISSARAFPTLGLKLLGNDLSGFPVEGFAKQSGQIYPSFLAWFWQDLTRLSKIKRPNKADAVSARKILTVLSFSRMIRISSLKQLRTSMKNFIGRMESPTESENDKPFKFDPAKKLGFSSEIFRCSSGPLDFTCLSTKPSSLVGKIKIPMHLPCEISFSDGTEDRIDLVEEHFYSGPYGQVKILTENGGKTRVIVPYNSPFVHAVSLYKHVRTLLNMLPEDVSLDQKKGHMMCKWWTMQNKSIVSADLTAMTDLLSPKLQCHFLRSMNLEPLIDYLFNLPVVAPNGMILKPQVLLMGFKGNFELGSLLHHWYVRWSNINRYVMCGDDLVYQGDLDTYTKRLEVLGPTLNRNKTVISKTVAVFCGEYYWMGHSVKPCAPRLHSFFNKSKKVASATKVFSSLRSTISGLSGTYRANAVWRITRILRKILRKRWTAYIGWTLPQKLRGMGYQTRTGSLLEILAKRAPYVTSALSVGVEKIQPEQPRWFGFPIQIDPDPQLVGTFSTVLQKGAVSFDIKNPTKSRRKDITKLSLTEVLEWYYYDQRVPLETVFKVFRSTC